MNTFAAYLILVHTLLAPIAFAQGTSAPPAVPTPATAGVPVAPATKTDSTPVTSAQPNSLSTAFCTECKKEGLAAYDRVFWIITVSLFAGLLLIIVSMNKSKYDFSEVVAEERLPAVTRTTDANGAVTERTDEPKLAGSTSRVIAMFGLLVMAVVLLGIGYSIVWSLFVTGRLPSLDGVGTYLLGGSALFAPYAFNQLKEVFGPPKR